MNTFTYKLCIFYVHISLESALIFMLDIYRDTHEIYYILNWNYIVVTYCHEKKSEGPGVRAH